MPRRPRIDVPETVFHVFTRGHNKSSLFLDDQDRFVFLKYLKRAQDLHPWDCLGYSLMSNHYHLHVKTHDIPLGKTMHYLNTLYAGYFNFRYKKVGHVFQNRYHSIPVQTDRYLLTLSRYIHLNPVAAGMVAKPQDYPWSSYREFLGQSYTGLVRPELVFETLSENSGAQRHLYQEFVEEKLLGKPDFDEETLWKTRVFGDAAFAKWIAEQCPASFATRTDYQKLENAI